MSAALPFKFGFLALSRTKAENRKGKYTRKWIINEEDLKKKANYF